MGLIGKVGARRARSRTALGCLYAVLALGALTTIYPFTVMVSTAFKGPTDQNDNRLIPAFWSDLDSLSAQSATLEGSLYEKFLYDKYAGDLSAIRSSRIGRQATRERVQTYERFLLGLPPTHWTAGFRTAPNQVASRLTMRYQAWLRERFATIDDLNRAYIEENVAFQGVAPPTEMLERTRWSPPVGSKYADWLIFKATLPAEFRIPVRGERLFQEHLRRRYQNRQSAVPGELAQGAASFEQIRLPTSGRELERFRKESLPARFESGMVEEMWRESGGQGELPIEAHERQFVRDHSAALRWEFSTRNYRYVLDYLLVNGRALLNTAIFCLLAVVTQLTVNPLAAYALSRYPLKATAKMLVFLLATMAFPAEVAMIPSFLLLKDLGLLNTFAALVLPSAASGYMIYLLKGFFDSLPAELYEAAQMDGAKESTMLFRVTLPLSRPVLGYMALLAFMGAYGAFMYAFLVAQDQRMWTLMVWIYQLQIVAPKSVMMAALTIAAIPTLVVFLASQRVIMRGIVLPGER